MRASTFTRPSRAAAPWLVLLGIVGLVAILAAAGCSRAAETPATSVPVSAAPTTPAVGAATTSTLGTSTSQAVAGPFVTVWDPYHSRYGDVTIYSIPARLEVDATVRDAGFPAAVPAVAWSPRPAPATDLALAVSPYEAQGETFLEWTDPKAQELVKVRESGDLQAAPLHDERVALEVAAAFLEQHGLDQADLGPRQVKPRRSMSAGGGSRLLSWSVFFSQLTSVTARGGPGVTVEVFPGDWVGFLRWDMVDLKGEGSVRLRPLSDVLSDLEAWKNGYATEELQGLDGPDGPVVLRVRGVGLGYERIARHDPADTEADYLVAVYSFAVEVLEPAAHRGATGIWWVVAAADVKK